MALRNITDKISVSIDDRKYAICIFSDLSKAFDTINHDILLHKLEVYGIRCVALAWLASYLSNRTQCVSIDDCISESKFISCEVPQGSILGPLLFLFYINNIVRSSDLLKFIMLADDTNLFMSNIDSKTLISNVNDELSKVSRWLKVNKLCLNVTKTNFIIFHSRQRYITSGIHLHIDGILIEKIVATKFLGVILNENLIWTDHVKVVLNKTSNNFGICRKLSFILPSVVVKTLYNSQIKPYIEYCNIAQAVHGTVQIDVLYRIQKKCMRMHTNSHRKAQTVIGRLVRPHCSNR